MGGFFQRKTPLHAIRSTRKISPHNAYMRDHRVAQNRANARPDARYEDRNYAVAMLIRDLAGPKTQRETAYCSPLKGNGNDREKSEKPT